MTTEEIDCASWTEAIVSYIGLGQPGAMLDQNIDHEERVLDVFP